MRDEAKIVIGGCEYTRFKRYRIESDLYAGAGAFEFELFPDERVEVKAGDRAQVYVNGILEMTGLIDRVTRSYEKSGRRICVTGRDLMGLVVDSYCEEWVTMRNSNLVKIAEKLLKNVPYISRKNIEADTAAKRRDAAKEYVQPAPGDRIFDVLRDAAASRGLVFYARADGSLCFRKPIGRGAVVMSIARRRGEDNTHIIRGERTQDFSERFSKYTVLTQEPGLDSEDPPYINSIARVTDDAMPFYKPFVESIDEDSGSVRKRADMILEQRRAKSDSVKYRLVGHSQGVWNWAVDELVRVDDDELGVAGDLLVYSRTFELSREGITTELTLGAPGLAV